MCKFVETNSIQRGHCYGANGGDAENHVNCGGICRNSHIKANNPYQNGSNYAARAYSATQLLPPQNTTKLRSSTMNNLLKADIGISSITTDAEFSESRMSLPIDERRRITNVNTVTEYYEKIVPKMMYTNEMSQSSRLDEITNNGVNIEKEVQQAADGDKPITITTIL